MPSFKDIRTKAERIFTAPHPDIKNPLSQRRARITSSMLLAVNLLYTIPEGIRAIFEHELPPYLLFFAFIFLVAYIISRTKYYQWGTRLMLLGLGVLVPIGVNFSPNFDPVHPELFLMWAVPAMILGALLLENAKQTLAYMVGLMLSLWFVLVLYPNTAIIPDKLDKSIAKNIKKICGAKIYDGTAPLNRITLGLFFNISLVSLPVDNST
jgi:hypothetical protein